MDELLTKLQKGKHRFPPKVIALGISASLFLVLVVGGIAWAISESSDGRDHPAGVSEFSNESTSTSGYGNHTESQLSLGEDLELDPSSSNQVLTVYVSGHIKTPGVYTLTGEARIADAIEAAGGPAGTADSLAINLAAHLTDGQQLYVPGKKEVAKSGFNPLSMTVTGVGSAGISGAEDGANPLQGAALSSAKPKINTAPQPASKPGRININNAGSDQLELLPGVGPAIAQRIISDRSSNGPFSAPEDLMRVSGIGEKRFEALKDLIAVR